MPGRIRGLILFVFHIIPIWWAAPASVFAQEGEHPKATFVYGPDVVNLAKKKLDLTLEDLSYDPARHPSHTADGGGEWVAYNRNEWTSGYFAGILWLMYRLTGEDRWQKDARLWTDDMEKAANRSFDHDTGLRISGSFGNGYRISGSIKYLDILKRGASSLSERFDPRVGAIKSWDPWETLPARFPVIIDNLMNLELLFMASENGLHARFYDIALQHARTTLKHHLRPDGTTYHIVDFTDNGTVIQKFTTQGYGPQSVWARGQAWAIYGFTMIYRYTGDEEFLTAAKAAADYFIRHLPEDRVPWYDFMEPAIPNTTKDASAAAIAASALFELSSFTGDNEYFNHAVEILYGLYSDTYSNMNRPDERAILRLSTRHRGDANRGTIYADYYFLEAVLRYRELSGGDFPELRIDRELYMAQNYPNPFNAKTRFDYSIGEAGVAEIVLYDMNGKKIKTLTSGHHNPGNYSVQMDASGLASGVYMYTLRTGKSIQTRRMILVR